MIRYENLRRKLRVKRKELNLTVGQAARRARMNPAAYGQLELGNRENVTIQTLADWATSLGGTLIIDVDFDAGSAKSNCWLRNGSGVQTCICTNTCQEQAEIVEEMVERDRQRAG